MIACDACAWLEKAMLFSAGKADLEAILMAGVFGPSLEPPIQWCSAAEISRVNCLLALLLRRKTMWAPVMAYDDHFDSPAKQFKQMRKDVNLLNDWRTRHGAVPLPVDWTSVAIIQANYDPESSDRQ
jgi:hypothetical protein